MPIYIFECYQDEGGCGNIFEITAALDDAPNLEPTCENCGQQSCVHRNYQLQNTLVNDGKPKTLGMLAEKNMRKLTPAQRREIKAKNDAYKYRPFTGTLPDGASNFPVGPDGKRLPSTTQRDTDPKRK